MDDLQLNITKCVHVLVLNSYFTQDVGLFNGKTGIAITFAHLYKQTQNQVYYDCMSELLDDILENVYKDLPYNISMGLSGIGWGIEYLLQQDFVEGDGIEICEEIDRQIMLTDPMRIMDKSLDTGVEGLLHYVLLHLRGAMANEKKLLPFDKIYLSDLYQNVKSLVPSKQSTFLQQLCDDYTRWFETGEMDYSPHVTQFMKQVQVDFTDLSNSPLGIQEGISGWLLTHLLHEETYIHI